MEKNKQQNADIALKVYLMFNFFLFNCHASEAHAPVSAIKGSEPGVVKLNLRRDDVMKFKTITICHTYSEDKISNWICPYDDKSFSGNKTLMVDNLCSTNYTFRVSLKDKDNIRTTYPDLIFEIQMGRPPPIRHVWLEKVSEASVHLRWKQQNVSNVVSVELFNLNSTLVEHGINVSNGYQNYTIDGLTANTFYEVKLREVNSYGSSPDVYPPIRFSTKGTTPQSGFWKFDSWPFVAWFSLALTLNCGVLVIILVVLIMRHKAAKGEKIKKYAPSKQSISQQAEARGAGQVSYQPGSSEPSNNTLETVDGQEEYEDCGAGQQQHDPMSNPYSMEPAMPFADATKLLPPCAEPRGTDIYANLGPFRKDIPNGGDRSPRVSFLKVNAGETEDHAPSLSRSNTFNKRTPFLPIENQRGTRLYNNAGARAVNHVHGEAEPEGDIYENTSFPAARS